MVNNYKNKIINIEKRLEKLEKALFSNLSSVTTPTNQNTSPKSTYGRIMHIQTPKGSEPNPKSLYNSPSKLTKTGTRNINSVARELFSNDPQTSNQPSTPKRNIIRNIPQYKLMPNNRLRGGKTKKYIKNIRKLNTVKKR